MKSPRSRFGTILPVILILAGVALGRYFGVGAETRPEESGVADARTATSPHAAPKSPTEARVVLPRLNLAKVDGTARQNQILRVVQAMDESGGPPEGVAQGGRRGGVKGVFQNAEGQLPRKAAGYWIESDVWPKNGPRGAERLIFGRDQEVYWTRDHYRTFVRLR